MSLLRAVFALLALFAAYAVPARAQSACPPASALTPGETAATLAAGGLTREYRVFVPSSYDGTSAVPLVLSLHGFTDSARGQARLSEWNEVAEREGFIVVYPQGTGFPSRWYAGQSFMGTAEEEPVDDVAFITDLLDSLTEAYCIDTARVYASGMSNGGSMIWRLACEQADRFAAVGTVAAPVTPDALNCDPARPVPLIGFHGTADTIVPYDDEPFAPFLDWGARWAAQSGCAPDPAIIAPQGDASGLRYTDCDEDVEVVLYTIDEGGHTWPGGSPLPPLLVGKTSTDIDASEVMWAFFERFTL